MTKLNIEVKQALANELAEVRESNTNEGTPLFQAMMAVLEKDTALGSDHDDICEMADLIREADDADGEGADRG